MKPRTQFDKQVVVSNTKLSPISDKVFLWALRTQVDHTAFRTSGCKCTCGDCGQTFNYEGKGKSVKCPYCGMKVSVFDTKKRKLERNRYFNYTEVVDDIQVLRTFRLDVYLQKGMPLSYETTEICRLWLNAKGQTALTSKHRSSFGYYADNFIYDSKIELKTIQQVHEVVSDCNVYPYHKLIPELRRNGFNGSFPYCHPFFMMKYILTDSRMETLMKGGHSKAVAYYTNNHLRLDKDWNSLKIAFRHNYEPQDYSLWSDTLAILEKLGLDTRCPKYICPDNLKFEHDRWNAKYLEKLRKEEEQKQFERAKMEEAKFIEAKSPYFGIIINDSDITISVLDSIEAYKEEGTAMHHCVFSASYYKIPDSIVLSARDKDGNRIETIEFSLKQGKVVQSRGVCNKNTEYHDRIVNLVNANAHQFAKVKATA